MKFLIYGKGWISEQVVEHLKEKKYNYVLGEARVDEVDSLKQEINKVKPTNILCLIGRTHGKIGDKVYSTIDYLEQPGKLKDNIRDNLYAHIILAMICKEEDIHLTILNTGCIFKYDEKHTEEIGFTEEDYPNFFDSSYSIVKGYNDSLMKLFPVCNTRIRMPISSSPHPRNFITKIINYDKICSVPNSMTVLDDLIPVFVDLSVKRYIGTVNLTNPGVISHNQILEMYKEIVDPSFEWKNFTYEEQMEILSAGRSNNYLDTTLLESMYDVPNITESVRNVLKKMREK